MDTAGSCILTRLLPTTQHLSQAQSCIQLGSDITRHTVDHQPSLATMTAAVQGHRQEFSSGSRFKQQYILSSKQHQQLVSHYHFIACILIHLQASEIRAHTCSSFKWHHHRRKSSLQLHWCAHNSYTNSLCSSSSSFRNWLHKSWCNLLHNNPYIIQ